MRRMSLCRWPVAGVLVVGSVVFLGVRGESHAAFDQRSIPHGPALDSGSVGSHVPGCLRCRAVPAGCLAALGATRHFHLEFPGPAAAAQEPASAELASQLAELMMSSQLEAIAGKDSTDADRYVAALAYPGQLLVVSARYEVPLYVEEKIANRQFRDVYIDLNAASIPGTKILVTDAGANGLRGDDSVDMVHDGSGILRLDGDWGAQNLSEADYLEALADADRQYARMLSALIDQVR